MYLKNNEKFPSDFLFGAATSAFQVEGGIHEDGRGVAVHDLNPKREGIAGFSVASDHYHHLEEDVALMVELGLEVYRFSISWVRILPDGKTVNEEGFKFYDKLIDLLLKNNIEPIVTIYHFEYPQKLVDAYGGWKSRESIDDYLLLAKTLFNRYKEKVKYWISINEQDHIVKIPERLGIRKKLSNIEYEKLAQLTSSHMSIAVAKATKLCHELIPGAKIGPSLNPIPALPASNKPEDKIAAMEFEELTHFYLLDLYCKGTYPPIYKKYLSDRGIEFSLDEKDLKTIKENKPDFLGINYYMTQTVKANKEEKIEFRGKEVLIDKESGIFDKVNNEHTPSTAWGWDICAEGLKASIVSFYNRYQLPMLITENGLGAKDTLEDGKVADSYRIEYLKSHMQQLKECVNMGYSVIGYCPWSFIDLVSGREGMDKRYGFVYVNRTNEEMKDLNRIKKDSFNWYQQTIKERGKNL